MLDIGKKVYKVYREGGLRAIPPRVVRHIQFQFEHRDVKRRAQKLYWYPGFPEDNKVIHISPREINYAVVPRFKRTLDYSISHVKGGSWDRHEQYNKIVYVSNYAGHLAKRRLMPFADYPFYQSFREHFKLGRPWEETEFYRWLINNQYQNVLRYETEAIIKKRLKELDRIFQSMRSEGYISATEAGVGKIHEISVDIGRNGQFLLDDGRHRLCMAKILDLESIPVRVFVRHRKWQQKRRMVALGLFNGLDHPDLVDVRG